MKPVSLEAKFLLVSGACALAGLAAGALAAWQTESLALGLLFGAVVTLPLAIFLTRRFTQPLNRIVQALADGVASFKAGDFSISLGTDRADELGELVRNYNQVGDVLRAERQNLFQRELLLDTVIQSTSTALVLADTNGRIVYSNTAARRLFLAGHKLEGHAFEAVLREHRPEFLHAALERRDGLFTIDNAGEEEIFHLSHGEFALNTRPHHLYLFKQLTRELNRQEVATWKKVIRVISHELNNSLAPITSLAHSGRELARRGDVTRLDDVFGSIEERAAYLKHFIDGYARFAKLPAPRQEEVAWQPFLQSVGAMADFTLKLPMPPQPGWFDPAQLQQVLLNLLKNAAETGCAGRDIEVAVRVEPLRVRVDVSDRGGGMSDAVLHHALLPFYSTKKTGTGLGLSLCREIIEAHGGRMSIANRSGGGLTVSFWLPRERAGD